MRTITRWIPKDSTAVEHPDGLGVAYCYTSPRGLFVAVAYAGKAGRSTFHVAYRAEQARADAIRQWFSGLSDHERLKAERRAEDSKPHTLKVGDILHYQWGWEQTNCEYYQVVETRPHSVLIRQICSETVPGSTYSHGMAEMRTPVPNAFLAEPILKRVSGRGNYIAGKHGSISPWDGKPDYCSWYA